MLVDLSKYTIEVTGERPNLIAQVVELPGCVAVGKTMSHLEAAIRQAIAIYLDAHEEQRP